MAHQDGLTLMYIHVVEEVEQVEVDFKGVNDG
jgi:hypothetical protein